MSLIDEWGYEQFCSFSMISKKDILSRIEKERDKLSNKMKEEKDDARLSRYGIIDRMFAALYEDVEYSNLFTLPEWDPKDELGGVWRYQIKLGPLGMVLQMSYVEGYLDNQDSYGEGYLADEDNYVSDASRFNVTDVYDVYDLIEEKSRLLTVEEYAKQNGVEVVTVRQWIRRGKLRSAIKVGGEWRIPELASIPNKSHGYRPVFYTLKTPMNQFLEGFEDVNEYNRISIEKSIDNMYEVCLKDFAMNSKKVVMLDTAARERFELYLISSGNVECFDGNDEYLGYE